MALISLARDTREEIIAEWLAQKGTEDWKS